MFGSELLQGLLVGYEQCDPDGIRVVIALEAADAYLEWVIAQSVQVVG